MPATRLWRFQHRDGRIVECWVDYAPNGAEPVIYSDGSRLVSRVFPTGTDAVA